MPSLVDYIDHQAAAVLHGECSLDEAIYAVDDWLEEHFDQLTPSDRRAFSATLDQAGTGRDESLIDSILRLHTTRLLYRYDKAAAGDGVESAANNEGGEPDAYQQAREAFSSALQDSEDTINEARIDIAVANAHNLLGNRDANRRWLDAALERLHPIAGYDLVAMAQRIPSMPVPRLNWWKRLGLQLVGLNFERLAEKNRASLSTIARMQTDQIIIIAHLLGTSYESIRERQRAHRAYRVAAYLVMRYGGMQLEEGEQLLAVAESMQAAEPEAAAVLAEQARQTFAQQGDEAGEQRALALLSQG